MIKEFYEKALPSQGVYCAAGIDREGKITNEFAETLGELFEIVEGLKEVNQNVFVALNTFNGYSRRAENAIYCRSFFIDLDAGDNPKKYRTKEEALASLDDFISIVGLPPPVRVDSGGGVHAYWLFDQDIPTEEWKPYALKFKQLCLDHIKIDPAVTADAARILRCPETFNYKKDEPVPTRLLDEDFGQYSFEDFKDFLGVVEPDTKSLLDMFPKGLDEDTKKIARLDNYETTFQDIAESSLSGEGCAQIKHILMNAATLEEPMWYAGLSIARHCTDWESAIHLMSEDHPGYNYENTVKKANQAFGKPFSCEKFDELNPGGCEGCPLKGRITNPLAIGKRLVEAPTKEMSEEDTVRLSENPQEIPTFPPFLKPYTRGRNGGVYFVPPPKVDEEGVKRQEDPICLSVNDLFPVKRMYSPADGECMLMRHLMQHDPMREFILPMSWVYAIDFFKKILSSNSVTFLPTHLVHLQNYVIKWNQYLMSKHKAEIMRMQMGWTENHDAFVIGAHEIIPTGETVKASASPLVRNISKLLNPVGEYDLWKESANALNAPGYELHAFGMLCGFGSPLMYLTPTAGVCVSFASAESGTGKTSAMYSALSIWGDPRELSVLDGNATDNAFVGRLLNLKNLPLGIDEASNADPEAISRLAHRISQGKAKLRMQSSVNAERDLEMTASLIAIFTTNSPLYDKLQQLKASPDGEVARIVEFDVKRPHSLTREVGMKLFNPFRFNYGHAGPMFIKYVYKIGVDEVKRKIEKWQYRFREDFGDDVSHRFYESLVAAAFAGGEIANEAGIISLDLEHIYQKVLTDIMDIRDRAVKIDPSDYKTLLGEFCNNNQSTFLIFDGERLVNQYDPRQLIGRIEMDTKMYYVSRTELNKFLASRGISIRKFEHVMTSQGLLVDTKKKRLGAGWKGGSSFHPVWAYAFKDENVENLVNELRKD